MSGYPIFFFLPQEFILLGHIDPLAATKVFVQTLHIHACTSLPINDIIKMSKSSTDAEVASQSK